MKIQFDYIKCPLNRYTFSVKPIKEWVEQNCEGKTLNLFAGKTKLSIDEVRNDLDEDALADYRMDALEFLRTWEGEKLILSYLTHLMLIVKVWKCIKAYDVARLDK